MRRDHAVASGPTRESGLVDEFELAEERRRKHRTLLSSSPLCLRSVGLEESEYFFRTIDCRHFNLGNESRCDLNGPTCPCSAVHQYSHRAAMGLIQPHGSSRRQEHRMLPSQRNQTCLGGNFWEQRQHGCPRQRTVELHLIIGQISLDSGGLSKMKSADCPSEFAGLEAIGSHVLMSDSCSTR